MKIKNFLCITVLILLPFVGYRKDAVKAFPIVVGHDINTLGSTVAGNQEETFAVNVANFLTDDSLTKNLLLFESNPGDGTRNFSNGVIAALENAGFNLLVTSDYTESFIGFDAVFVAQDFPTVNFLNNNAIIDYVNNSGGVYLAGGVGPNPSIEAQGWSTFLNSFGLGFDSNNYNGINNVSITSSHPIFAGITSLNSGNGQSIIDLGTNPNAEIVQFANNQGVYAIVETQIEPPVTSPEPSTILSLLTLGGIALGASKKKQV